VSKLALKAGDERLQPPLLKVSALPQNRNFKKTHILYTQRYLSVVINDLAKISH
jgi:hypothetical protein